MFIRDRLRSQGGHAVSGARFSIGAIRKVDGKVARYGRHKRTGKFVRWGSPYGRYLRAKGVLAAHVTMDERDEFRKWAKAEGFIANTDRVATELPLRLRALAQARALYGVVEQGGNNRGPEVDKIIRGEGGTPGQPWCGYFAAHVYRKAGSKVVQRGWAATSLIGRLAGMTSHDKLAGKPGDLVVFNFPGGGVDSDHVGLLVHYTDAEGNKVDPEKATHVKTIDGNTTVGLDASDGKGGEGVDYRVRHLSLVDRIVKVHR